MLPEEEQERKSSTIIHLELFFCLSLKVIIERKLEESKLFSKYFQEYEKISVSGWWC